MNSEVRCSLLLNLLPEVGPGKFQKLISHFGSAEQAVQAGLENWQEIEDFRQGFYQRTKPVLDQKRKEQEIEIEYAVKNNIQILLCHQIGYPERLKQIHNPPPVLYVKGASNFWNKPSIALVGSRRCSHYGEKVSRQLASELAQLGVATVSGLARGIDTYVHEATMSAGGLTFAVIGSGLLKLYPPENRLLAERIETYGAVVSEFPLMTVPHPSNFPRRNRIIAGLSLGTVLIEGTEKSGALITARLAAEEGRDVFAVPGPITSPLSAAPHRLLRLGAKMVESAADIVSEFSDFDKKNLFSTNFSSNKLSENHSDLEKDVLAYINADPISREELFEKFGCYKDSLASQLLIMEMKGLITSLPGGRVVKK